MLYKNTFIKIRKSLGRYLSLLLIVMIGVGFFYGIHSSAPTIVQIADNYYREHQLMDFKIISTMGLTEEDVQHLKELKNVADAIPSYSLDVLEKDKNIRLHSLESSVNQLNLTSGRMPLNDQECIADSKSYHIGDHITVSNSDQLKHQEYQVVGLADSVLYLTDDYGSSTIGDGKLSGFAFINKDNFQMDAYTEIYVTAKGVENTEAYSKEYQTIANQLKEDISNIKKEREEARYQEIYDKASATISENEQKLKEEKVKGEKELADGKAALDDGAKELSIAQSQLDEKEALLITNEQNQTAVFSKSKEQLDEGWQQIDSTLSQNGLTRESLPTAIRELETSANALKQQLLAFSPESTEYLQLSQEITALTSQHSGLLQLKTSIDNLAAKEEELNQGIRTFHREIANGKSAITQGRETLMAKEQQLNEGYAGYRENLEIFQEEIKKADKKIDEAKKELTSIEQPKWYISDRDAVNGYTFFNSSIGIIRSLAAVLPFFFILIVVLMTSNSMTRMIAEERSELGALTSLGYKDQHIIGTYLLYVLSATGLGVLGGFFIGGAIIPPLIYSNFQFILPDLTISYSWLTLIIIMAVTLLLMATVTLFACYRELKQKPASLLRPVPPKSGHTLFLERIGILWKHLSFTWKITMRNMFRYKKRAFMTIVGIAGCAALMLVGFGLRDSMNGIAEKQYGELLHYDNLIILKKDTAQINTELGEALKKNGIINPLLIKQTAFKCNSEGKSADAYLIVPENEKDFPNYFTLRDSQTENEVSLTDNGAVVTQKVADVYGATIGDSIIIKDGNENAYTLRIDAIAENYVSNYIYMSPESYEKVFSEDITYNSIVSSHEGNQENLAKNLMENDQILNVVLTADLIQKVLDNNRSLDSIIILLVVVASLLAIIVLYNLTSINISERTREIATLKVLGFRDGETNAYIYREALILTGISIGIGLILGTFLHRFVVGVIEGNAMVLFKDIHWFSFLLAAALTMIFSIIMQVITYIKLKSVDMIQSLKSVE